MSLRVTVEPTVEPVTLEEAKAHLRIDGSDEDDLIAGWIEAARRWCEAFTNRRFIHTTMRLGLDGFTDLIEFPQSPLSSVSSITYVDSAGDTQTLSASVYQVDTYSEPGRISLAYAQSWPTIRAENFNPVQITAVVGYGTTPASVPANIKAAIKLLVGHWYEHREPVVSGGGIPKEVPLTVEALLYPFRVMEFA